MTLPAQLQGRLRLPVVASPMFLASGPDLVIACCRAGVVGTFPALNLRTTADFDGWLTQIETALADEGARDPSRLAGARTSGTQGSREPAPFGVNFIVHKTNRRLAEDLEVIVKHEVPLVITSLGAAKDVVDAVHSYGGLVFHDVTNAIFARKAAEAGVDGLILVSGGAGGHAGSTNPFALVSEVRQVWDGTLLLAGALTTGADVLAAQALGADLAYMGTRFLATHEATIQDEYKAMIVESQPADIVYTPSISTIPASFLRQSIVDAGLDPERLAQPERVDLEHLTNPHTDGEGQPAAERKAWRDIWTAGQGVAGIGEVLGTAELVDRLEDEYERAKGDLRRVLEEGDPSRLAGARTSGSNPSRLAGARTSGSDPSGLAGARTSGSDPSGLAGARTSGSDH